MNIYEHHEIKGWFFLPEDPDNRVPGVLKWDPSDGGSATVELIGGFLPAEATENNMLKRTIYLETVRGEKYSVWDGVSTNSLSNGTKTYEEHWYSNQIYFSDHILPTDASFTKATFELDELYYVADDQRIFKPEKGQGKIWEQIGQNSYSRPFLSFFKLPILSGNHRGKFTGSTKDAQYSINTWATHPYPNDSYNHRCGLKFMISVGANVSVMLRNEGTETGKLAGTASDLIDRFVPIYDLMRLATFQPCGVANIQLQQHDNEHGSLLVNLGEVARPNEHHEQLDVVFTLNDTSLENFLKERERLTNNYGALDSWNILISFCGYSSNYMEEYISQILAAIESFHKRCLLGKKGNLKERLEDLYSLLPQKIRKQIKFDDDIEIWAELAANVRHRAAHAGPQDEKDGKANPDAGVIKRYVGTLSISDRNAIAVSAHLVTYLVLLNELGVSSEAICNALNMHPKISTMVYYCSKVRPLLESIKNLPTS
jgi:hypothetical protein